MSASSLHLPHVGLTITNLPIAALKPNPQNPRLHSKAQIKKLARSIKEFGFVVPVLTDPDRNVIAGHGRLEAAKLLDLAEVPTICIDHLTAAQIKAYTIADNALTLQATWDEKLLAVSFKELSAYDLNFDVTLTGFDTPEIDFRIEGLDRPTLNQADPADAIQLKRGPAVTQADMTWQVGRHRVRCGDARDPTTFDALMDGVKAKAVITDPPYNVRIDGHASGLGVTQHAEFAMASGEMTKDEFVSFLVTVFGLLKQNSKGGSLHYIFIDWRHVEEMLKAGGQVYDELKNLIVWNKSAGGMGGFYRSAHELVCLFKNGSGSHTNNVQLGRHGRNRTNVWAYPAANQSGTGEEGRLLRDHPTPKPVRLLADAILDCSARNDIILDCFLGIGSTLVAAERIGRSCYGIEIEPKYVDTAIRRWQAFTGEDAIDAKSGRTFNELGAANEER